MMNEKPDLDVEVEPEYDHQYYWLVLPVMTSSAPRIVKTPPQTTNGEVVLKLNIQVPRQTRKVIQTITVKMPTEFSALAQLEVEVASNV